MDSDVILNFPPFRLDPDAAQLYRAGQTVALRPKAYALLEFLVVHAGSLLTKDALLTALWPDRIVSEAGLTELIRELRRVLGDDARAPRYIETVHGRGYRFVRPVPDPGAGAMAAPAPRLDSTAPLAPPPTASLVVGREAEFAALERWLAEAEQGRLRLVFVSGEPGIGKTTLIDTFQRALAARADTELDFARGQCIEHYGSGEAFLPVLEALARLARQPRGARVVEALRRCAPSWLAELPALQDADDGDALARRVSGVTRERMLRELAEALDVLAAERTLVLVLEDVHWSDYSTLDVLTYLAQRREPARLMLLASFRPAEVYAREHPLRAVKQELQVRGQCEEIELTCLPEAAVDTYLARRFAGVAGAPASHALAPIVHRRTDGHPLFMVNVADYVAAQAFAGLPDTVESRIPDCVRRMIEMQLERLDTETRGLLEVASVVGVEFSMASVAAGLGSADPDAIEQAFATLARRGQFLVARGAAAWPDGTLAARFAFIHALYQNVLYFHVTAGRRARLHLRIAEREERAFAGAASEVAAELAAHFEAGHDYARAVRYLLLAGERAVRRSANREAIDHYQHGFDLLERMPDDVARARAELLLCVGLGVPLIHTRGYAAPEVERVYSRARVLHEAVGVPDELFSVLWGLWLYYVVRGEHPTALDIGRHLVAHAAREQAAFPWAHYATGCSLFWLGELTEAGTTLERGVDCYARATHATQLALYSQDPKTVCLLYRAWNWWLQGEPERALAICTEAAAWAVELQHPFSLAFAHNYCAVVHYLRREPEATLGCAEQALAVSAEYGFPFWAAWAEMMRGWTLAVGGCPEEGMRALRTGLTAYEATGAGMGKTLFLAMLAEVCGLAGDAKAGLTALAAAQRCVEATGEEAFAAELARLEGELLLRTAADDATRAQAEACFGRALAIARRQGAQSWELRAAQSLARVRP